MHSRIAEIVAGLVARKKYIYLCTNALKLEESLDKFTPSKYLAFSVHMDGPREEHDHAVCRDGVYDVAREQSPQQSIMVSGSRQTRRSTRVSIPRAFAAFLTR